MSGWRDEPEWRDEAERRDEDRWMRERFPEMYKPHLCELVNLEGAVIESFELEASRTEIALIKLSLLQWPPGEWRVTPIDEET